MIALDALRASPNALAPHYARFGVADRLLLSGHSHQAWPDVAREGVLEAFDDAARHVDEKWARAFATADAVRAGLRVWLDDDAADLALGASTHELVVRMVSSLDLARRPRLVTTDGEFHTLRRQLGRAAEAGLDVVRVAVAPVDTLAARLAHAVDDRTAAVFVSAVLFASGWVVDGLGSLAAACARRGAELVVDAYHALGPTPFSVRTLGLDEAWVVGGGYKYLQLGEGNCFLRVPPHARAYRPAITGWYAEFGALAERHAGELVAYGTGGAARFAGSTYDPTSHYRAARVMAFFAQHGLTTPAFLPTVYRHQVAYLARAFDALDLPEALIARDRAVPLDRAGGFLALRTPHAGALQAALAQRDVLTDSRGDVLRLGPAPYLSDAQLDAAIAALRHAATSLSSRS